MNKIVKKTMAAALALTVVSGGVPAFTGGNVLTEPAIVVDAASEYTITYEWDEYGFCYAEKKDKYNTVLLSEIVYADIVYTYDNEHDIYVPTYKAVFKESDFETQEYITIVPEKGQTYRWGDLPTCWYYKNKVNGELVGVEQFFYADKDNNTHVNGDYNIVPTFFNYEENWIGVGYISGTGDNGKENVFKVTIPENRKNEVPIGVTIVSGSGTVEDPFKFEAAYDGAPMGDYEEVTVGKKWYIGDTINTDAYFSLPILHAIEPEGPPFYMFKNYTQKFLRTNLSSPVDMSTKDAYGDQVIACEFENMTSGCYPWDGYDEFTYWKNDIAFEGNAEGFTGIEVTGGSGTYEDPFTIAPIIANQPSLVSNTMTLGGSISLNFYYDLSQLPANKKADTYVEFEVNGKKQTANFDANKMNSKKTAYGFTCMLTSVSMADDVKATMHYFDENGNEKTFVTNSNGQAYLQKFDDTDGAKTYDLVKAVNDFGYHLQKYLCNAAATPWTYGVDHVSMAKCFADTSAYLNNSSTYLSELESYAKQINKNADINKFNYSLSLEADTTLIVRVKPEASYTGSLNITVTDPNNNPVAFTTSKMADGRTQVNIPNISAHKLGDTYTVSVKTTKGTSTFKASALSYVYEGIKDFGSAEELSAMCSIYEYYKKTIAFRTK